MNQQPGELVEYLYIDESRVNMYFDQISSPVKYDKVPVWKALLGFTGPKAEATQSRPGRPYTLHEKVARVVEHILDNDLCLVPPFPDPEHSIQDQGPSAINNFIFRPFRLDTMSVYKMRLPIQGIEDSQDFLDIWVSEEREAQVLYLLEDQRRLYDGHTIYCRSFSPYSALMWDTIDRVQNADDHERWLTRAMPGILGDADADRSASFYDPLTWIRNSDTASKGQLRRVNALYRIRAVTRSYAYKDKVSFGYPIVIREP